MKSTPAVRFQKYGDYVRVVMRFRERFWEDDLFWLPTGSVCGEGTVLNVLLSGRACGLDALAEVAKVWPEAPGLLVSKEVADWRGRALPYWAPGDIWEWSDSLNERAERVLFAGDWYELEPGMEAAVRSGLRAARKALKIV